MELIDSHCHIDAYLAEGKLDAVLEGAKKAGVVQLIGVGTDLKDWSVYKDISDRYLGQVYYTAGLHPCHVNEGWEDDLQALMPYFAEDNAPVALGEIGLDFFHLPEDKDEAASNIDAQKRAFAKQLSFAYQLDCPVIIHSRNAFDDCVAMIDASGVDWKKVVFHCFVEGAEQIKQINKRGGRGSFTGVVTYKKAEEVRQALLEQGIDKLMVETDAPYLAPVPHRGKTNYPEYVVHVAETCADLLDVSYKDFCERVTENTRNFFGINC